MAGGQRPQESSWARGCGESLLEPGGGGSSRRGCRDTATPSDLPEPDRASVLFSAPGQGPPEQSTPSPGPRVSSSVHSYTSGGAEDAEKRTRRNGKPQLVLTAGWLVPPCVLAFFICKAETERERPSGSLPRCSQQPDGGQATARSRELPPGLLGGRQGPKHVSRHLLPPRVHTGRKLDGKQKSQDCSPSLHLVSPEAI